MMSSTNVLNVSQTAYEGNAILNKLGFRPLTANTDNWSDYPTCSTSSSQLVQRPFRRRRSHSNHREPKSSSTDRSSSSTTYSDSSGGNPFASESDNESPSDTYENSIKTGSLRIRTRPCDISDKNTTTDHASEEGARTTKLNELAGDLTSFLSRVKYLYDESETGEPVPLSNSSVSSPTYAATLASSSSSSSSYSDQRALIKAQADRVRNQLEMKFSAIAFGAQLDHLSEKFDLANVKPHYNPLHTIRGRQNPKVSPHLPRHSSKVPIWQISVAELIQDLRWRYNQDRVTAQKQRGHNSVKSGGRDHKPRNISITTFSSLDPVDPLDPSSRIRFSDEDHSNLSSSNPGTSADYSEEDRKYRERNDIKNGGADTQFTNSLPHTDCTKLIDRLRNQHDENEIALLDDDNSPGLSSFNKDMMSRSDSVPSLGAGDVSDSNPRNSFSRENKWAKRFCRNSASVADTWNRMNKQRQNSTQSDISAVGDLKPLSINSVGSTTRPSSYCSEKTKGRKTSVDALEVVNQSSGDLNDQAITSSSSDLAISGVQNLSDPLLVSTNHAHPQRVEAPAIRASENGSEVSLDIKPKRRVEPTSTQRSRSVVTTHPVTSQSALSAIPSVGSDKWMGEEFGSLNIDTVRRNPLEKKCCHMAADLRYLKAFYTTALHRPSSREVLRRCDSLEAMSLRFPEIRLSDSLKDDKLPEFLEFLGNIETTLVSQQQELDVNVATPLDGLRVSTDLMVSEVNTTLNRRIREIGSRIERLSLQRSGCAKYTTTLYCLIEHAVTLLMWAIWCFVKCVRVLCLPLRLIRFLCSIFVIA